MTAVYMAGAGLAALAAATLWLIHADHRRRGTRSSATAALVWVAWLGHAGLTLYAAVRSFWPLPLTRYATLPVGLVLLGGGAVLFIAGLLAFRSWDRVTGVKKDLLVRRGVYRWSRNPQNTGWGLLLSGAALLGHSGAALVLAGAFWLAFRLYLVLEERHLEGVFGREYRLYVRQTARFWGLPKGVAVEEEAD